VKVFLGSMALGFHPYSKTFRSLNHLSFDPLSRYDEIGFETFQKFLLRVFKARDVSQLPFQNISDAFTILCGREDFSFNDPKEKFSSFLILMACLSFCYKKVPICYLTHSMNYAVQSQNMRDRFLQALGNQSPSTFATIVPGMIGYMRVVKKAKLLFMHGGDFSCYLPKTWHGRKIIQIFGEEEVFIDRNPQEFFFSEVD
jgi:hypothetical protein